MTSETPLDYLMNLLDPEDRDIDEIIQRMRTARATFDAGGKPQKEKPKVDTSSIMAAFIKPVVKSKLRRL